MKLYIRSKISSLLYSVSAFAELTVQSCPWVGSTHGLGWVEIFSFLVGWVVGQKISTNSYPRYIIIMFVICTKL